MKKILFTFSCAMTLLAGSVYAQNEEPRLNIVTTSVPFLRISTDARAGAMGDLGVATSPDANSSFYNLAKTPFNTAQSAIAATYTPWLKDLGLNDVYLLAASGYHKLDDNQALSASIRYFSLGNITLTDFSGNILQDTRPREMGIDVGYSRKLSDRLGLGIALRYIHSNLVGNYAGGQYKAGNAVAGDVSLFYTGVDDRGQGWNFGATLTNLGSKIGYTSDASQKDYIPANLSLGTAYTHVFDDQNKIMLGVDIHKLLVPTPPVPTGDESVDLPALNDYRNKSVLGSWFSSFGDANGGFKEELKEFTASIGAEYSYDDLFFVRTGYFYEDKNKGNRKFFSVGVGLKYNFVGLNFSYLVPSGSGINRNPLSNTLRLGVVFDLGFEE